MKQLLVLILLFPLAAMAQHRLRCAAIADGQASWKLIDTAGNIISDINETYERNHRGCEGYSEGMFCHEKLEKLGFKNWLGKVVVKPVFSEGRTFTNGCAAVKASKWGMVNRAGKLIADTIYDYISDADSLGTIVVEKDKRLGIIDASGHVVLPCSYYNDDKLFPQPVFSDGLLRVLSRRSTINEPDAVSVDQIGNYGIKIGFVDRHGKLVIDTVFELKFALYDTYYRLSGNICGTSMRELQESGYFVRHQWHLMGDFYRFEGNRCVVFKDQRATVIDNKGDVIYRVAHDWRGLKNTGGYIIAGTYSGYNISIADSSFDGEGVYNPGGKEIIPFKYRSIGALGSGFFKVQVEGDSPDGRGNIIYRLSSYRYADTMGQFMPFKFCFAYGFFNGLAEVALCQQTGYHIVNTRGKLLDETKDGVWVRGTDNNNFFIASQDKKYGFMDNDFNWTIKPAYELCEPFSCGLAAVKLNGKWGYINTKGELVIQPQFQVALPFSDIVVDKYK